MIRVAASLALVVACNSPAARPDAPSSPWSTGPLLPVPRIEAAAAALGQQLVVLGGFDQFDLMGFDITARVDLLDVATGTWSQLPDAPVAWTHAQLAVVGTTLYLLGGLEGQYIAHGESFALDTQTTPLAWRPLATMPAGFERGSAGVVVVPPRIYLLGGAPSSPNVCVPPTQALASVLYFDASTDTWTTGDIPDLPQPRSHPAAMRRTDGTLVLAGGLGTVCSDSQAADVWTLTPGDTQWVAKTPMALARGGCAYGVVTGQLVCAGGEASTSALPTVESYDPIDDLWTTEPMMPDARAGIQGAAIGTRLFVPGGTALLTSQAAPTDTLYIYAPLDTAMQ